MSKIYIFNSILIFLFLTNLLLHLYSRRKTLVGIKDNNFQMITKSLLVPILIFAISINAYVLISNVKTNYNSQYVWIVIIGLLCGFIGDVLLINWKEEEEMIFTLLGLAAFLIGHIFIMIFIGISIQNLMINKKILYLLIISPIIIMPLIIWQVKLIKNTKLFIKIIICIYALCLICLLGLSITTIVATNGNWKIALPKIMGSLFFVISDSILGLKIFRSFKIHTNYVMLTYGLAQGFLSASFVVMLILI